MGVCVCVCVGGEAQWETVFVVVIAECIDN